MEALADFPEEIKLKVSELKQKGNPVFITTINDVKYIYQGLLTEDWITIRSLTMQKARKMSEGSEKLSQDELDVLASEIEELEGNVVLEYAIVYPEFSATAAAKMPAARTRRLRELVFAASGDNETVSDPVQL